MIKNYLKIAWRNLWRHKGFSLINIIGLSIGISAAIVIYLMVHHDFTFDKFHKDGDRIYRVVTNSSTQGVFDYNSGVCGPLAAAIKNQVTGMAEIVPFYTLSQPDVFITGKKNVPVKFKSQDNVILADQQYFKLFNYTWLAGSSVNALNAPNQVVLTSEQAKRYFPGLAYNQMIGQTVTYDTLKTTVTGIVQTLTKNTDFTFEAFISYRTGEVNKSLNEQLALTRWNNTSFASQLFIKLSSNAIPANVEKQLNALLKKNNPPGPQDVGDTRNFSLQPLSDVHFNGKYGTFGFGQTANKTTLYALLTVASFLLLLACINFINLTTAQAAQRAKEIGIRKTMGSSRAQLIVQFLSETFFITALAVIISVALTPLLLKLFADFISTGVKADFFHQPGIILFLLVLIITVSFLSGFYPAIILSGYKPVAVLKNQAQGNGHKTRSAWLRKSLTVSQFVISQFFIMSTILVSKQIYYALHKELGFKKDAIVVINSPWKNREISRNMVFMNKLRAMPQVKLVSMGAEPPSAGVTRSTTAIYTDGKNEVKTSVEEKYGDENYIKVYQIKLLAGRNIQAADTSKALMINATYARILGFKYPGNAAGKLITDFGGYKNMLIAGVVADFHERSLRTPIKPLAILMGNNAYYTGTFHIGLKPQTAGGGEWKKAIATMEKLWKEIYPGEDFEYHFFDENIARFYEREQHTSTLLSWATGLSVCISCLGLLGLVIYTTGQRTKEVGVRKILGASVTQVAALLSGELLGLIILAFIVVTPIAWWAMNKWMQNFADRTAISWWIFALSPAGMLLAAMITSGFQTIKAAIANPINSLRSE